MSRRWRWIGGLAVAVAGCGAGGSSRVAVRSVRGELVETARASGELRAVRSEDLIVPATQRRLRIARLVEDGQEVAAGQVLVAFDPSEFQKELRDKQADLGSAGKELEKARLEAAAELERLQVELERTAVDLEKARIRARRDGAVTARNEIRKAEADVGSLEVALAERRRAIELARSRQARQQSSLEARIRRADEAVRLAQEQLAALALRAPVAGTALLAESWMGGSGKRKFQVGDNAWRGQAVVTLPDLSEMEAMLFVEEADIARVRPGQVVRVTLDAAPDRVFLGRVRQVPPLAERLSWSNPAKVFRVVAALDATDPAVMRPGLRLQAELELDRHADVITVPLDLVAERGGKTYVERGDGRRLEVVLGARNAERVIVTAGLEVGIELRPPREDGS